MSFDGQETQGDRAFAFLLDFDHSSRCFHVLTASSISIQLRRCYSGGIKWAIFAQTHQIFLGWYIRETSASYHIPWEGNLSYAEIPGGHSDALTLRMKSKKHTRQARTQETKHWNRSSPMGSTTLFYIASQSKSLAANLSYRVLSVHNITTYSDVDFKAKEPDITGT